MPQIDDAAARAAPLMCDDSANKHGGGKIKKTKQKKKQNAPVLYVSLCCEMCSFVFKEQIFRRVKRAEERFGIAKLAL